MKNINTTDSSNGTQSGAVMTDPTLGLSIGKKERFKKDIGLALPPLATQLLLCFILSMMIGLASAGTGLRGMNIKNILFNTGSYGSICLIPAYFITIGFLYSRGQSDTIHLISRLARPWAFIFAAPLLLSMFF